MVQSAMLDVLLNDVTCPLYDVEVDCEKVTSIPMDSVPIPAHEACKLVVTSAGRHIRAA